MKNGRCRLHGGLSTGPKTAEGIERIRRAKTKHGIYTAAAMAERKRFRDLFKDCREVLFAAKRVLLDKAFASGVTRGFRIDRLATTVPAVAWK
jgi:hypothetical protein